MSSISEIVNRDLIGRTKTQFLARLDKICGRIPDADDELTRQIYESARAKGFEVASELGHDWVTPCLEYLQALQHKFPYDAFIYRDRIRQARKNPKNIDQEAHLALSWAQQYFSGVPQEQSDPVVLELAVCLFHACFSTRFKVEAIEIKAKESKEFVELDSLDSLEFYEQNAQARLGSSIRDVATAFGILAFFITGHLVFIPIVLTGWVMAYALIDRKAIEKQRKALLLGQSHPEDLD